MRRMCQMVFGIIAGALLFPAAPAYAQMCGTAVTAPLYAGQTIPAGTVKVFNDANYLYVQYVTESPWVLSDAHVAVASTLSGIPQTKTGNPIPGRFAYSATFDPELSTYTVVIPNSDFTVGQNVVVAAHAVVQAPKNEGGSQTAWGFGPDFSGSNWATYVQYQMQPCGGGGSSE